MAEDAEVADAEAEAAEEGAALAAEDAAAEAEGFLVAGEAAAEEEEAAEGFADKKFGIKCHFHPSDLVFLFPMFLF